MIGVAQPARVRGSVNRDVEAVRSAIEARQNDIRRCFRVLAERCRRDGRDAVVEEYRFWAVDQVLLTIRAAEKQGGGGVGGEWEDAIRRVAGRVVREIAAASSRESPEQCAADGTAELLREVLGACSPRS